MQPKFYGHPGKAKYCDLDCPFFQEEDPDRMLAHCSRDGRDIEIYDWYLAHCPESGNLAESEQGDNT